MYQPQVVLASTSRYRRELLERLTIPFLAIPPECDETPRPGESPKDLSIRLAQSKAVAVADQFADALIIGSDQVAELDGKAIGKPGTHEDAVIQLENASGNQVRFHTAVAIVDTRTMAIHEHLDQTIVFFRDLNDETIDRYLLKEKPYDCAGSFKSEGLGISLFRAIQSNDPTALMGLPLIWVSLALQGSGVDFYDV